MSSGVNDAVFLRGGGGGKTLFASPSAEGELPDSIATLLSFEGGGGTTLLPPGDPAIVSAESGVTERGLRGGGGGSTFGRSVNEAFLAATVGDGGTRCAPLLGETLELPRERRGGGGGAGLLADPSPGSAMSLSIGQRHGSLCHAPKLKFGRL